MGGSGKDWPLQTQFQSLSQHRGLRAGWEAQGQAGTLLNYFLQGVSHTRFWGQQHIKVPHYSLPGTGPRPPPPPWKPGTAKGTHLAAQHLPLPVLA